MTVPALGEQFQAPRADDTRAEIIHSAGVALVLAKHFQSTKRTILPNAVYWGVH